MKILLQTNRRNETLLSKEYDKLVESGFEIIPFGYLYEKEEAVRGIYGIPRTFIKLTGIEDVRPEDQTYTRVCIPVIRDMFIKGLSTNLSSFRNTIQYNARSFRLDALPVNSELINKTEGKFLSSYLLNVLDNKYHKDIFMKPNDDLKLFSGTLVPAGKTLKEVLTEKNELNTVLDQITAAVHMSSNILDIAEEVRCYVVNKKVVTISKYRSNGSFNTNPITYGDTLDYIKYAQNMIDTVYSPCDNFTIDIAKLKDDTLKVIEYNCLTSSGLYECDSKALFTALKNYYY